MKDKIALVTGASSGIGRATVEALLAAGCTVFATARRMNRLATLASRGARILPLDVTDDVSMRTAVNNILAEVGRIDILINNAGYGCYGSLEDVPMEDARRQFEVNLFGLARLTQLVIPHMRQQRSGRIVNVTSVGAKIYGPLGSWYHASKYGVEGLSDCLRLELKPFGIDVIMVEPAGTLTEWGGIATESLLKNSGHSDYAAAARGTVRILHATENPRYASPPKIVARGILRALQARRPKARYPLGKGARLVVALRKFFSDRMMDGVIRLFLKIPSQPGSG